MDAASVCAGVPEQYRAHAMEICEQLAFMQDRLEESRRAMAGMPLIMAYKDSNGNPRTKENPAFSAYNSLMRNYCRTLSEFRDLVGDGADGGATVLKFEKFARTMKKAADA